MNASANKSIVRKVVLPCFLILLLVTTTPISGTQRAEATVSTAFPYVLDSSTVFPYPTYGMPIKGVDITDPTFHTIFQRVTQKSVDGYPGPATTPEYSKADPSNANGTRLILRGLDAYWYLYDGQTLALLNGGPIPNLPQDEIEPRWDAQNPSIFYYLSFIIARAMT